MTVIWIVSVGDQYVSHVVQASVEIWIGADHRRFNDISQSVDSLLFR